MERKDECLEKKIANLPRRYAEAIRAMRFVFIFLRDLTGPR
jgi:hypothetical protein